MNPLHYQRSQSWGALWIGLSIAGGAFGAHGLKSTLAPEALAWWNTGCNYGIIGGFSLCISSLMLQAIRAPDYQERRISRCFHWGTLLFCTSLWVMALSGWRQLGLVTPFGGSLLIAGWLQVAYLTRRQPL